MSGCSLKTALTWRQLLIGGGGARDQDIEDIAILANRTQIRP